MAEMVAQLLPTACITILYRQKTETSIVCGTADTTDNELHGGYISRISPQGERLWERKVIDMQHPIYDNFWYSGLELDNGDLLFTGGIDYVVDTTYPSHIGY